MTQLDIFDAFDNEDMTHTAMSYAYDIMTATIANGNNSSDFEACLRGLMSTIEKVIRHRDGTITRKLDKNSSIIWFSDYVKSEARRYGLLHAQTANQQSRKRYSDCVDCCVWVLAHL